MYVAISIMSLYMFKSHIIPKDNIYMYIYIYILLICLYFYFPLFIQYIQVFMQSCNVNRNDRLAQEIWQLEYTTSILFLYKAK